METRRLLIGCDFTYVAEIPTPVVFQVEPAESPLITTDGARWDTEPALAIRWYADLYGNSCVRLVLPAGRSTIGYHAVATVPDATEDADEDAPEVTPDALPDHTLIYTLPSRYCLPDVLGDESWARFGGLPPGYRRVQAICDYVHGYLTFQYGSSTAVSSAVDVNRAGFGVCRDFTHLAISFCRALNIPARYVFGYLPFAGALDRSAGNPSADNLSTGDPNAGDPNAGDPNAGDPSTGDPNAGDPVAERDDQAPMDFAAWMEVWLGDRWWTFDPRNNTGRKGRVVIGRGRDATDVAMATTFGGPFLESMVVQAEEAAG